MNPICCKSSFFILATLVVGILRQAGIVLIDGLAILGDAVMANIKKLALNSGKRGVTGGGLSRPLGVHVEALLQDGLEGVV